MWRMREQILCEMHEKERGVSSTLCFSSQLRVLFIANTFFFIESVIHERYWTYNKIIDS